jgi:hypothetical protein
VFRVFANFHLKKLCDCKVFGVGFPYKLDQFFLFLIERQIALALQKKVLQ